MRTWCSGGNELCKRRHRMRHVFKIILSAVVLFVLISCGGGGGSSDCEEVNRPAKTKLYGQSCTGFYYGSCPDFINNCLEGSCSSTRNGTICSKSCTKTSDCPSGLYCSGNTCMPPATCRPFYDGILTCDYSRDPNDPTSCVRGRCY